jgi:hypothetical protein
VRNVGIRRRSGSIREGDAMKTKTINVYQYSELSDKAKEKARVVSIGRVPERTSMGTRSRGCKERRANYSLIRPT